jgi:hypothetical protein
LLGFLDESLEMMLAVEEAKVDLFVDESEDRGEVEKDMLSGVWQTRWILKLRLRL